MVFVIPFFIPHQGCPHQCLFCNQNLITGKVEKRISMAEVENEIHTTVKEWLGYRGGRRRTQFAFYGGSFTCLERELQIRLLRAVQPWIECGEVSSIRLSTRPDCVDGSICETLTTHGVEVVELGVQSLDDRVLQASLRGHSAQDCTRAVTFLRESGMVVGMQLMPGLPLENRGSFRRTIDTAVSLAPDFVRLYPALVVRNSGLEKKYVKGEYTPLSLPMAAVLVGWAKKRFEEGGIRVVRMGLQHSESLAESILVGPHHPAFGEIVISREWLKKIRKLMAAHPNKRLEVTVSPKDISALHGKKNGNKKRLAALGLLDRLTIKEDQSLERGTLLHVVGKSA